MALDVLTELANAGAIYTDKHFVVTSGKHTSAYINCDPLYTRVSLISDLCDLLIAPFVGDVDTVAGPATGGIVLGALSALAFNKRGENVASTWADKSQGGFAFERAGFVEQIADKRVLVVEDLLNTGGSVDKVCRLVEAHGGTVAGVSVVCNRGPSTAASLQVPRLEALAKVQMEVFDPDTCPLCSSGVPIVDDISHGDKYKAEHPGYPGGYVSLL